MDKDLCKHCQYWSEPAPDEGLPANEYGFCEIKQIIMYWDETYEAFTKLAVTSETPSRELN